MWSAEDWERHLGLDPSAPEPPRAASGNGTTPPGRHRIEPLSQLEPVVAGCDFVRWARDHQASVSEPLWHALLSNLARCHGGREAAHAFSREYPGYTPQETDTKFDHARQGSKPVTCARIQALGFQGCPPAGHGVTAPVGLGWPRDPEPETPKPEEAKAEEPKAKESKAEEPADGPSIGPTMGRRAIITRASDITPEPIEWLWPGRLAVGALTILVGLPDQGKTLLYCGLAARISTGAPFPPAPRLDGQTAPRRVLILTNEDSLSATVVPRLIKAGADLESVDFVQMVRAPDGSESLVTLAEDLDVLEAAMTTTRYTLLVVDGIMGYLGRDAKTHNDADVRRVLTPFVALLERVRVAGIGVAHPPKSVTTLSYYIGGSVAFTTLPRVVLGVAPDPEDTSDTPYRLLAKLKGNLYGRVPTLAYKITAENDAGVPWLEWADDPVKVDLADVFNPVRESPEDRSSRLDCVAWIRAYLDAGPRPADEAEQAAVKAGFSKRTIKRAKKDAGVDSAKQGMAGPWLWILPPERHPGRPR
jgi:putative DNA primase/helicase